MIYTCKKIILSFNLDLSLLGGLFVGTSNFLIFYLLFQCFQGAGGTVTVKVTLPSVQGKCVGYYFLGEWVFFLVDHMVEQALQFFLEWPARHLVARSSQIFSLVLARLWAPSSNQEHLTVSLVFPSPFCLKLNQTRKEPYSMTVTLVINFFASFDYITTVAK